MKNKENAETLISDSFNTPGDLPVEWRLFGDLPSRESAKTMAGVGGTFDAAAENCLHLIKFKGPRGSMGIARGLKTESVASFTISFRMAACCRRIGAMLDGLYCAQGPGFAVRLRGPSGQTPVSIELAGENGRILINEEETGCTLPMLVWQWFSIRIDEHRKTVCAAFEDQPAGQTVAAPYLAQGITEIAFGLPENEEGYAALWLDDFSVSEGVSPVIRNADRTARSWQTGSGLAEGNRITPFEPGRVRALGNIGARLDLAIGKNAMALDMEGDFLAPYARTEDQGPKGREELEQGIFVGSGSLLDALARMAFYSQDPAVMERAGRLTDRLTSIQHDNGYIGVYPDDGDTTCPLFTEFCLHDAVYLVLGFAQDYRLNGRDTSLTAARKLAAYIRENWQERPPSPTFTPLGINEAFIRLFHADGDRELLEFIGTQRGGKQWTIQNASLLDWDQHIWKGGHPDRNKPEGGEAAERHSMVHVYRLYERCMAQLMLNEIEPDERLTVMPRRVIELLMNPEKTGMLITGASGSHEGWEDTQMCTGKTGETCTTVYGIWFMEALLRYTGDPGWGDWMERMIYNSLFCAQAPEGRRLRYFSPPSGRREYYHRDTYCCPNNFRRGIVRLPEQIYYRNDQGLAVNLFEASAAEIEPVPETMVRLRQITEYPAEETSAIVIEEIRGAAEFSIALRIPSWCGSASVTVNGEPAEPVISRPWKSGDRIDIRLPMPWRFVRGRCMQAGRAAVMRGPVAYCLSRELNGLPEDMVLRDIIIDPSSVETAERDSRGVLNKPVCRIRAWSPGRDTESEPDLTLLLHEFPEPTGEEIYFRMRNDNAAVDDELFTGKDV